MRTGHNPPREPIADWWVLTTANTGGTNGLTCLPMHRGARAARHVGTDTLPTRVPTWALVPCFRDQIIFYTSIIYNIRTYGGRSHEEWTGEARYARKRGKGFWYILTQFEKLLGLSSPTLTKYVTTVCDMNLEWCPGQKKRIAPLSFVYGCRKRRLKELIAFVLEIDCGLTAMGFPPISSAVFLIAK
jgi:hypothetical protein